MVDPPIMPHTPVSPDRIMLILIGIMLGIAAGVGSAIGLDLLIIRSRTKTPFKRCCSFPFWQRYRALSLKRMFKPRRNATRKYTQPRPRISVS